MSIDVDAAKVERYRPALQYACACCLWAEPPQNDADEFAIELRPPEHFSRDFSSIIVAAAAHDGRARLCVPCSKVIDCGDAMKIGQHAIDRLTQGRLFKEKEQHEQLSMVGLCYMFIEAVIVTNALDPGYISFRSLSFAHDLSSSFKTMKPIHGTTQGVMNEFVRDLGLGCYVSFSPLGEDTVYLHDFASKSKHRGNGGLVFPKLLEAADRTNVILMGMVEAHGNWGGRREALSDAKLLSWYRRFGFEQIGEEQGRAVIQRHPL